MSVLAPLVDRCAGFLLRLRNRHFFVHDLLIFLIVPAVALVPLWCAAQAMPSAEDRMLPCSPTATNWPPPWSWPASIHKSAFAVIQIAGRGITVAGTLRESRKGYRR